MTAIMLELRSIADPDSGKQRGAWAWNGGAPGAAQIVDVRLDAGRLAICSFLRVPTD